jgi:tetratricopeptide (TPR) repeat protein
MTVMSKRTVKLCKRCLSRWLTGCLVLAFFTLPTRPVLCKTSAYKQGLQNYTKGEFDKAIQNLQKALNSKPSKTEKTIIYKYIGLSLFTLGRRTEAERNFEQCLAHDSKCSIDRNEALDESVLPFFQDIRRRQAEKESSAKAKAKTKILVKTSAKDAEVLLDGILLGPANSSLDAESGTVEIILQAKGYQARRVKIAINKLVENVYVIELDKIAPKPEVKPVPKVDPKEKARLAKLAAQAKTSEEEAFKKSASEKDKARKIEARNLRESSKEKAPPVLPNEDFLDGNSDKAKDNKKDRHSKHANSDLEKPRKKRDDGLELAEERGPPPATDQDSFREVTKDATATADESPKTEGVREPTNIFHFLPLGIGQFHNGDFLLGTAFLGAQLYSAGVIALAYQDIEQAEANQQTAVQQAQIDPNVTQADINAFTLAKNNFVNEKQQRIDIALGILAGTYGFGVLHAIIMRPIITQNSTRVLPESSRTPARQLTWQLQPTPQQGLQLAMRWDF